MLARLPPQPVKEECLPFPKDLAHRSEGRPVPQRQPFHCKLGIWLVLDYLQYPERKRLLLLGFEYHTQPM